MKHLTRLLSVLLALTVLLSLAACSAGAGKQSSGTVTVTDHFGNTVTLPSEINRIVVCDIYPLPSVLAVFFDSAEKIVGMAAPSMTAAKNSLLSELYPEILDAKTDFIDGTTVNIEELMKLEPDVVFYGGTPSMGEQFANAGIPAVGVSAGKWDYDAIETLNNWIRLLSEIFPGNDRYETVKAYSDTIYNRVQERVKDLSDAERERVFFLFQYNDTTITTSGKHFFGQWWADAVGAKNVGEEMETDNSTAVSMEQIYAWNPGRILITNFNPAQPADLLNNTVGSYDWSEVAAVKEGKINKMPLGMYRSYTCGVDTPVTLVWMAKTVYPDLFEDFDITAETLAYYRAVFGIELTAEQANRIFDPSSAGSAFN
ncbi:MAG: ABC transporter substrate-binding protein [Clostridia bacterium]|nr:ABC transporter substrate-binding protein [Clostridia bacterium]MBR4185844.1 ABC transporter substrate-binding protein [Clostridia bacterium]